MWAAPFRVGPNKIWPNSGCWVPPTPEIPTAGETSTMGLHRFTTGALALALLSAPLFAVPSNASERSGWTGLPGISIPGPWSRKAEEPATAPVQLAQAGDPRMTELQEQIRRLSGTVEELNFQILQMQEQMRKQQEDFEFRFQELEGGSGAAAAPAKRSDAAPATQPAPTQGAATSSVAGVQPPAGEGAPTVAGDAAPATAAPSFGTITFDASGAVTGGSVGDQSVVSRGAEVATGEAQVAALPPTENPEELYQNSYEYVLAGDYATAEAGFRDHLARFPTDARNADAEFWLGEALLAQNKYREAAEVFLAAGKDHPKSKKAPEMLLKLGVSLAGLNQRDVACATFGEVGKRYPNISPQLKNRVTQEKSRASC